MTEPIEVAKYALLAAEWGRFNGEGPYRCVNCNAGRWEERHQAWCRTDSALTAMGLDTPEKREDARKWAPL